jgi:hypothetical protein
MDKPPATQFDEQIQMLEKLSGRMRSGSHPERLEIDGALERGFGRLIALEAELQRVANRADQDGKGERIGELRHAIDTLREALNDLRTQSSPPGPPRIGYGFVLPESRSPARRPPIDGMPPAVPGSSPGGTQHN